MMNKLYKKYHSSMPIIKRHVFTSLPYFNFSKLFNILLSKYEELLGKEILKSKPYFIKIEPTNKCNLKCPGCLHAINRNELRESGKMGDMDIELFKKIINSLKKYLISVSLYFEGEPLVAPQVKEMLKILKNNKIGSIISSNLNYLPDELAKGLVKNKLTRLIICLDGYDEESYQKYRKGGSFKNVINNIKKILEEKEKQKSNYPILEVQTINFEYFKEKEIEKIKKIVSDLKVKNFTLKDDLRKHYNKDKQKSKKCFWLYGNPSFLWDGTVEPCCYYYDKEDNKFGNIREDDIFKIWNNEKYRQARRYFKTGEKGKENLRCYNCDFFQYKKTN